MAVATQLQSMGDMQVGDEITTVSAFDTTLKGKIINTLEGAKIISITGESYTTARSHLPVDPLDPLTPDDGLFQILDSKNIDC